MRLGHIGLTVANLNRSKTFYEAFGFKEKLRTRRSNSLWLNARVGWPDLDIEFLHMENECGVRLELLKYHSPQMSPGWIDPPEPGHSHISLVVDDASAYGNADHTEIPDGPQKGMRGFYMRDPDGHTIEIMEEANGLTSEISKIIDKIEAARSINNSNWCDLIRLCYKAAPDEARQIFRRIEAKDEEILRLAKSSADK